MKLYVLPILSAALLSAGALQAQTCSNLVANPNGTNSTTGWTLNGGNATFPITTTTDNSVDCFVFQNAGDYMTQSVDLTIPYTAPQRATRPTITFSEQFKTNGGGSCTGASYKITVTLEDSANNALVSWTTGTQTTSTTNSWESIVHSFVGYSGLPDHVVIKNEGSDCNSSANSYGTEFTAVSLTLLTPANTDGTATADQKPNSIISYDDPSSCTQTGVVIATASSNLGSTTVVGLEDDSVLTYHGQPYVQRHYEITPTNQSAATITLYVDQADFTAYNTARNGFPALPASGDTSDPALANLVITAFHGSPTGGYDPANYVGATPELIGSGSITKVWNAEASRWEFSFPIAAFSGFFFSGGNTALDISMGSLALSTRSGHHALSWTTYNEAATDYFVIERSANGREFSAIGRMACSGRPGAYTYTDASTPAGTSYYRLKMMSGKTGAATYSNVVSGQTAAASIDAVSVFPNPAADGVLNIRLSGGDGAEATLTLADAAGRELQRITTTAAAQKMDVHGLPAGMYLLTCSTDGGARQTVKVTVQ